MFDGSLPSKTPASIAASVRRSARHQAAEDALTAAKARRDAIGVEMREISGRRNAIGQGAAIERRLTELEAERSAIVASLQDLRSQAIAGRAVHAVAVHEALTPIIAAAGERGYQAVIALEEAMTTLGRVNRELQQVSGEPIFIPFADLRSLVERLGRLAGRG